MDESHATHIKEAAALITVLMAKEHALTGMRRECHIIESGLTGLVPQVGP